MATVWVVAFLAVVATVGEGKRRSAAVWVDDGHGRTIRAELPPKEAKVLTMEMLDLFGLHEPPKHRHRHHVSPTNSAPIFLKSIYDTLDERGRPRGPALDPAYKARVTVADTIITFVNRDPPGGRKKHDSNSHLYFNVANVSLDHSLLAAELRIHRSTLVPDPEEDEEPIYFHVYLVIADPEPDREIARTVLPPSGWVSVNVTSAVLSWIIFPHSNHGLRIAVTKGALKHKLKLHDVHVSGAHDKEDLRPFMLGFFALPESDYLKRVRTVRSIRLNVPKIKYKQSYMHEYFLSDDPRSETQCQKKPLHVSFRDLGWEEWVIAPEGYDANFCQGRCEFPLLAGMNATNHAIVQTLVKSMKAVSAGEELPPSASCAPRELTTISVLYYDYANNVVLKKYPKMIVKTCGCL